MRPLYLAAALLLAVNVKASAQCLTDFTKVLPEPSFDFSRDFGRSFSVHNDILAVGISADDSLGRIVGIVYL